MSIGTRTDKKQGFQDKIDAVNNILEGIPRDNNNAIQADEDETFVDDTEGPSMHDTDHSMGDGGDPNIQPGLDQHRIFPQSHTPMQANMGSIGHAMQQQMMHGQGFENTMHHHMQSQNQQHMSHSPHPLSHSMNMQ